MIKNDAWKIVILIAAGFLSLSAASLAADTNVPLSTQDVVAAVENHFGAVNDMTAKIVQKNFLKSVNKTQVFEGGLWIKKPGRLRLEYTNGQMILVDNKSALFYSRKNEQVIKKTFTDFEHMNIPVTFLLGAGNIQRDFDVAIPEADKPRQLELLPKKTGAAMKKLRLQSDETGRILGIMIYDKSGNTTEITFADMQEGKGVDDKVFLFKAPKGTEIVEQ